MPRSVEEYQAGQLALVFEDMEYLFKAGLVLRSTVITGNYDRAARVARAWASFALAMSSRIELMTAYQKGAVDALIAPAEEVVCTHAASEAIRKSGTPKPAERKPMGGDRRQPALHDCGKHGTLTVRQMAEIANVTSNAIYVRLRNGMTPEEACSPRGLRGKCFVQLNEQTPPLAAWPSVHA